MKPEVNENGNVGIGTTNPTEKLDICNSSIVYSRGEAKSSVPVVPRDNNVLLRMSYKNSIMGIRALAEGNQKFKQTELEQITYTVAGFGERVKGLEIGDEVVVNVQPDIIVNVPGNKKDLKSLGAELDKMTKEEDEQLLRSGTKWEVIEYGVYSDFQLKVVFTPNTLSITTTGKIGIGA